MLVQHDKGLLTDATMHSAVAGCQCMAWPASASLGAMALAMVVQYVHKLHRALIRSTSQFAGEPFYSSVQ